MLRTFRDEMEVGDTFYIVNRENGSKVTYTIDDKYVCSPYDVSCLAQNSDGLRKVTIITCTDGGLTRVIFTAHGE